MTEREFAVQFHLLCKGFRFEATVEQTNAWFRKAQIYALEDWTEAVSTLLCGTRFPRLDDALEALERARESRKRATVWKDRKSAEQTVTALQRGQDTRLSPELWACIRVFARRQQVRHFLMITASNAYDRYDPAQRARELAALQADDRKLTADYERLLPTLSHEDLTAFMARYGHEAAA